MGAPNCQLLTGIPGMTQKPYGFRKSLGVDRFRFVLGFVPLGSEMTPWGMIPPISGRLEAWQKHKGFLGDKNAVILLANF